MVRDKLSQVVNIVPDMADTTVSRAFAVALQVLSLGTKETE